MTAAFALRYPCSSKARADRHIVIRASHGGILLEDVMRCRVFAIAAAVVVTGVLMGAQGDRRPASPAGSSATQVGGKYVPGNDGPVYQGGKWIEITYGRPIKRGRDLFGGAAANYGKTVNPDAPVWRAGANNTTQLTTEV